MTKRFKRGNNPKAKQVKEAHAEAFRLVEEGAHPKDIIQAMGRWVDAIRRMENWK